MALEQWIVEIVFLSHGIRCSLFFVWGLFHDILEHSKHGSENEAWIGPREKNPPHEMKNTHTTMIIFNHQQHFFLKEISWDFQVQAKNSHFFMGGKGVVSGHPPCAWQLGGCPLPWFQASTNGSSDGIYESRRKAFIQRPLAAWRGFFFWKHGGWCDNDKMYICM